MANPSAEEVSAFLTGRCEVCQRQVLTTIELSEDDSLIFHCLECGGIVDRGFRETAGSGGLSDIGYEIFTPRTCGSGGGCRPSGCNPIPPDVKCDT